MNPHLQHILLERLAADEALEEGAVDLILAACESEGELVAALSGQAAKRTVATEQPELEAEAPGAYVSAIRVQGFRGVGPAAEISLNAGPGLTLVVGRNGSGKSSFAEGLELLLTGENRRWSNRTRVWTGGWQNLHVDDQTVLSARLQVDGQPGETRLERRWERGEALSGGTLSVKGSDGKPTSLGELGWTAALNRYRPFLSYNELGLMFDELKTMYDALAAILGLEDIETLAKTLREARLERERAARGVRDETQRVIGALEPLDDERVTAVLAAMRGRTPDLDAIELALAGEWDAIDPAGDFAQLRGLASLRTPDAATVSTALAEFAGAEKAVESLAGSDAARAASLAALLESALRHDAGHRDPDCPVCGTAAVIDDAWREHATAEVERLGAEASDVEAARRALRDAREKVAELLAPRPPRAVSLAGTVALDAGTVEEAWQTWREARERLGEGGSAQVEAALSALRKALHELAEAAEAALEAREDVWRPVAKTFGAWLPGARAAAASGARLSELKTAETWVKDAAEDLQASRLAPIAQQAKANWDQLRQESNVALEGFHLRRSGNMRSAEVDVRVDGSDASAFGVMSQGELHALAVSVFLPRASLKESPFRFMVIDDPVQSMDPTKVDGLARVLAASARQPMLTYRSERRRAWDLTGTPLVEHIDYATDRGFLEQLTRFDRRNPYNALIAHAADLLVGHVLDPAIRGELAGVRDALLPQPHAPDRLPPLPARLRHWEPLLRLSQSIVDGFGVSMEAGVLKVPGFVVKGWQAWETLVTRAARRGITAGRFAAHEPHELGVRDAQPLLVDPDGTVRDATGAPDWLLDAKYRTAVYKSSTRVDQADVYEAFAFARAASVDLVALLYPQVHKIGEPVLPTGAAVLFEQIWIEDVQILGLQVEVRGVGQRHGFREFSDNLVAGVGAQVVASRAVAAAAH